MRALCGALVLLVVVCVALGLPSGNHKHNHHKDFKHTHAHKGHKQVHKTDHVHSHEEFNYDVNVHTAVKDQANLKTNDAHKAFMVAFLRAVLTRDKTVDFIHGTGKLHGGEPAWKTWIRSDSNPLRTEFGGSFVTWDGDTEDRTQVQLTGAAKTSANIYGLEEKETPLNNFKVEINKLNKAATSLQNSRSADDILADVNLLLPEEQGITNSLNTLNQDIATAEGEIHHNQDATEEDLANRDEILQRIDDFDTRNEQFRDAHNSHVDTYNKFAEEVDEFAENNKLVFQLLTKRQEATALITEVQNAINQARIDAGNLQTAITNAASDHIKAVQRAQALVQGDNDLCDKIEAVINAAIASRDKFSTADLNGFTTPGYKDRVKGIKKQLREAEAELDKHNFDAVQNRVNALRAGFKAAANKACKEAKQKAVNQGGDEGGNEGGGIRCTIF